MATAAQHAKVTELSESGATTKEELNISREKVAYIIIKAKEFDVKVDPVEPDPGSNPSDMQQREILEDYKDDPTEKELRAAISALNDDEKADLVALVWIGRGDFEATDLKEARAQAIDEQQHVADYLMGTPLLGDLLEDGLSEMGYSIEEFEIDRL